MKTKPEFQDLLELIFELRNKAYGAYFLRRNYQRYLTRATAITASLLLLVLVIPIISASEEREKRPDERVVVILPPVPPLEPDKVPPPPPPMPKVVQPKQQIKTQAFLPPSLRRDSDVAQENPPPVDDSLKNVRIGSFTRPGQAPDGPEFTDNPDTTGSWLLRRVVVAPKPVTRDTVFEYVEQMPEFPGGREELLRYLQKNTQYPEIARTSGIEGTAQVRFVVDEEGNVSQAAIVRDPGGGCGKEALRVIKSMPRWKPGKQNGKKVKVWYTVPVRFKIQ
jgi:protein TonB